MPLWVVSKPCSLWRQRSPSSARAPAWFWAATPPVPLTPQNQTARDRGGSKTSPFLEEKVFFPPPCSSVRPFLFPLSPALSSFTPVKSAAATSDRTSTYAARRAFFPGPCSAASLIRWG